MFISSTRDKRPRLRAIRATHTRPSFHCSNAAAATAQKACIFMLAYFTISTYCDANSAVFTGILNRIKRANDMLVTSAVCCCYCAKNTENVEHQLCDCNRDYVFQLLFADTCGRWRPNCMVLSLLNWCFRVEKPDFVTGCKNSMILRRYCVVNSLTSSDLNR